MNHKDGTFEPPQFLVASKYQRAQEDTFGPVFWPKSVLDLKNVEYSKAALRWHEGKDDEPGLYRDRDLGTPTNCIALTAAQGK